LISIVASIALRPIFAITALAGLSLSARQSRCAFRAWWSCWSWSFNHFAGFSYWSFRASLSRSTRRSLQTPLQFTPLECRKYTVPLVRPCQVRPSCRHVLLLRARRSVLSAPQRPSRQQVPVDQAGKWYMALSPRP
jgi:hypothetical protein